MNGVGDVLDQAALADAGSPAPTHKTPANSAIVEFLQSNVLWVAGAIFTMAVLVAAIRTAWEQRAQPIQQLLKATLLFVAVSAAGAATLQLLAEWSDELAEGIITSVHPDATTLGPAMGELVLRGSAGMVTGDHAASLMTMLIGVFVVIAGLIQVVLMVIRSAMLILLAGTFPLAAAATNTEIGRSWFKKYCGWALAFLAYKPAAALIYAAAMRMNELHVGQSSNTFVQTATGLMMLVLAIFALPALLRFMVPVTAAVAGGSAGMGAAAADPAGWPPVPSTSDGRRWVRLGGSGGSGGGSSGGGGGASGAIGVGGPAGAGVAAAGAAVNGARKLAGGVAGQPLTRPARQAAARPRQPHPSARCHAAGPVRSPARDRPAQVPPAHRAQGADPRRKSAPRTGRAERWLVGRSPPDQLMASCFDQTGPGVLVRRRQLPGGWSGVGWRLGWLAAPC